MHRLREDVRAVSNVIVVMLSLVLVVIIAANVVLWSYQMNQFDWERNRENLKIADVAPVFNSSWFPTEREYTLNAGGLTNGTYIDTQTVDGVSERFVEGQYSQQETLHPDGGGQYADWNDVYPGGTAHWDACDEEYPDEDGSYVASNTATWKSECYNLEDHTGSGTINWVRIYIRARLTNVGTSPIRTLIRTHNGDYESNNISLMTSYQDVYTQYDTNPDTGTEWTWSEVDSLQAGASSLKTEGSQSIRMTAVWVVVDSWIPGGQRLDFNGTFNIDLSTYPLDNIETVEIQLRYRANDASERWYLRAYNWTDSAYGDSGFNNTLGHSPTANWDVYTVSLTSKWRSYVNDSGTIGVKFQDDQADVNQTAVEIDFLAVRAVINGMKCAFENRGALTCHLVSLWMNNFTHHQRIDINIFVNAGETVTHIFSDMPLPKETFIIKVVTERGNIAIYPQD